METSKVVGTFVAILIGIGVLYYKYGAKDRLSEDMHDQVIQIMEKLPDYGTHEGLYIGLVETHHKEAFDDNVSIGGRRSRVRFDGEQYLDDLFGAMAADAEARGYKKQAEQLRALRPNLSMGDEEKRRPPGVGGRR